MYRLADVVNALAADHRPSAAGGIDVDELMPLDRKAWFQSENERVKLESALRNLVPVDEVQREMASLAKAVASGLDSWLTCSSGTPAYRRRLSSWWSA